MLLKCNFLILLILVSQICGQESNDLLYPFSANDYFVSINDSSPELQTDLNFNLPFFGIQYDYIRVSINGHLSFSDYPPDFPKSYPIRLPNTDYLTEKDPSFIGIFHTKARIGKLTAEETDQLQPGVYFQVLTDLQHSSDEFSIKLRNRLGADIRSGIIGSRTFVPKHAIIVTWKNITFQGGVDEALTLTNTFQTVLVTDEVFTYVMFNYALINWSTHTEAGGDTRFGSGGVPALIGFNAGNGTGMFEYSPYSQRSTIFDITSTGYGDNLPGRHIFRIDEEIKNGNCDKYNDGVNMPLLISPESGNMLGGSFVNITGPCFAPDDKFTCKFGDEEVEAIIVDRNRAVCVQPQLKDEGYVKLTLHQKENYKKWSAKYFVETPATASEQIFNSDNNLYAKSPKEINIIWNTSNFSYESLNILLWGYREFKTPEFLYITTLASFVQNSGNFTIDPSLYQETVNEGLDDLSFGFIQISSTVPLFVNGPKIEHSIWSRPFPLAWYFGPQLERKFGPEWLKQMCSIWSTTDSAMEPFTETLPNCPCTLSQALADKGRFLSDPECDKDFNPKCNLHPQAVHCVQSGTPSSHGGQQQCCYDKNHYLMLSQDQLGGSYPSRSHNLGPLVPTLSNWFNDIAPLYQCCFFQSNSYLNSSVHSPTFPIDCERYSYDLRPSDDCTEYEGPGVAGVYGDPHIITFDNTSYTFNGKGEFVLVRSNTIDTKLDVQGRFEQILEDEESRATKLTSVVARGNSSTIIEVRLRQSVAQHRYRLDVIADAKLIYFDRPALKIQHFPGVTVYTPSYIFNQSQVIIMFDSGAGVEVTEHKGFLSAKVYLPKIFMKKTIGLLGSWTGDDNTEFTLPEGTVVDPPRGLDEMKRIYDEFGLKFMLQDRELPNLGRSLFFKNYGRTSEFYNDPDFRPEFSMDLDELIPDNQTEEREKALYYCGNENPQCIYDYAMTYDQNVAKMTKFAQNELVGDKETAERKVISCGMLPTPRFGRKSTFRFVPGTRVNFDCNPGYMLVGTNEKICSQDRKWLPENEVPLCVYLA